MVMKLDTLHTKESLIFFIKNLGVKEGDTLLVHSSLRATGWVCGGAETVIGALLEVLGSTGTLLMPTHTAVNSEPSYWSNPPVPTSWWQTIRDTMPAFIPTLTPSYKMGAIPELFRTWEGTLRSNHPVGSFAAKGREAHFLIKDHSFEEMFGEHSPIGKLYELNGKVLLWGVDYDKCTSLHLAEYRASFEKSTIWEGCAKIIDGERVWHKYEMQSLDTDDFIEIGEAYETTGFIQKKQLGSNFVRLIPQRPLVDFAVEWMSNHR